MKTPIKFFVAVSSLLLCASSAQADGVACHDPGPGMTHGSMGIEFYGTMDANGDGVVSKSEFDSYHTAQFEQMDGNKDGNLTLGELNAGHQTIPVDSTSSHLDRRFNAADANHNGGLDKNEAGGMPMLSMYFDEVDANKDGKVTRQEYFDAMPLLHKAKQDKANML